MISLSREGFTIDVVTLFVSRTLLNPLVTPVIAALVAIEPPGVRRIIELIATRFPLIEQTIERFSPQLPPYQPAAYAAAGVSLVLWANNTLNKWSQNNWVRDPTWDFDREIVLVTGGASGIGHSIIKHLLVKKYKTTVVVVDYIGLTWKPPKGSKVHYYQCDLSNSSKLKEVAARIKSEVGNPTVLVNNAGLCRGQTIMEGSYADVELTIRTNLTAPFLLVKEFLPHMVERNHGHIVNVGSMSSVLPPAAVADYAATKAGLTAMTEALQLELQYRHKAPRVRTSLCIFSFVKTPLFKGETRTSQFMVPLVHVDTVGESLAEIITSGYGKIVYLPGIVRYLSMARGGPEWLMRHLQRQTEKLGVIFNQPNQEVDVQTGYLKKG